MSDTRWRPSNAGNRSAVVPIHSDELLRVGEVLIRNLQQHAGQDEGSLYQWPSRLVAPLTETLYIYITG